MDGWGKRGRREEGGGVGSVAFCFILFCFFWEKQVVDAGRYFLHHTHTNKRMILSSTNKQTNN